MPRPASRQGALSRQSRAAITVGIGVIVACLWTLVKNGAPEHARTSVQFNLPAPREAKFQVPRQRHRAEPAPELELAESTPAPATAAGARLDACPVEPFTRLEFHTEVSIICVSGSATCPTPHPTPARIGHGVAEEPGKVIDAPQADSTDSTRTPQHVCSLLGRKASLYRAHPPTCSLATWQQPHSNPTCALSPRLRYRSATTAMSVEIRAGIGPALSAARGRPTTRGRTVSPPPTRRHPAAPRDTTQRRHRPSSRQLIFPSR